MAYSRRSVLAATGVTMTAAVAGCMGNGNGNGDDDDDENGVDSIQENDGLHLLDYEIITTGNNRVEAELLNDTGETLETVGLAIRLFDENGDRIGPIYSKSDSDVPDGETVELTVGTGDTLEEFADYELEIRREP